MSVHGGCAPGHGTNRDATKTRPTLRSRLFRVWGLACQFGFAHDTPLCCWWTVWEDMSHNSAISGVLTGKWLILLLLAWLTFHWPWSFYITDPFLIYYCKWVEGANGTSINALFWIFDFYALTPYPWVGSDMTNRICCNNRGWWPA